MVLWQVLSAALLVQALQLRDDGKQGATAAVLRTPQPL